MARFRAAVRRWSVTVRLGQVEPAFVLGEVRGRGCEGFVLRYAGVTGQNPADTLLEDLAEQPSPEFAEGAAR